MLSLALPLFALGALPGCSKDLVLVHDGAVADREAVLILPGLGYSVTAKGDMADFADTLFTNDFDVVVPDYLAREGLDASIDNVSSALRDYRLREYGGLHVFAYIAGTWSFNTLLQQETIENLTTVVYDRSPLQERAPFLATTESTALSRVAFGPLIFDIADTPFPQADPRPAGVGLIIENRATSFIRRKEEEALAMGPVSFDADDLDQDYDDAIHVALDHDEMYRSFDIIGPELIAFFQTGRFTDGADREPLDMDPFVD